MLKLSKASKMPCPSWSLEALDTCAGSRDANGELVPTCADCYAAKGFYRFPVVKAARKHNKQDWKRDEWESDMIMALEDEPYFRWFDSGDVYSVKLLHKIKRVIENTPDTMHWLPTRMYKFDKFRGMLREISRYANVVVRWSVDHGWTDLLTLHSPNMSIVLGEDFDTHSSITDNNMLTVCRAKDRGGKCGDCRACWNKDVRAIAYIHH